jgi:hypothetical protein
MTNAQRKPVLSITNINGNGQQLQVTSYEHQTTYIVSGGDLKLYGGTMYLIQKPSHSYEEAVEMLFKHLVMDDREHAINYYNLVSSFFIGHFGNADRDNFKATLTSRWHKLFLHVELERRPGLDASLMFFHVHEKEMLVSLESHPIVYILANEKQ